MNEYESSLTNAGRFVQDVQPHLPLSILYDFTLPSAKLDLKWFDFRTNEVNSAVAPKRKLMTSESLRQEF